MFQPMSLPLSLLCETRSSVCEPLYRRRVVPQNWAQRMGEEGQKDKDVKGQNISTVGVDIGKLVLQRANRSVVFSTWDFAGQVTHFEGQVAGFIFPSIVLHNAVEIHYILFVSVFQSCICLFMAYYAPTSTSCFRESTMPPTSTFCYRESTMHPAVLPVSERVLCHPAVLPVSERVICHPAVLPVSERVLYHPAVLPVTERVLCHPPVLPVTERVLCHPPVLSVTERVVCTQQYFLFQRE